jgi:inhibitor of cysteine peptidase
VSQIVVSQASNGGTVSARVGDSLIIELPETPTTGFQWSPVALNATIVEQQGDEFTPTSDSTVGGGGTRVFRFLIKGRGSGHLQFKLARAWESGPPSTHFDIRLNVE